MSCVWADPGQAINIVAEPSVQLLLCVLCLCYARMCGPYNIPLELPFF